MAEPTYTLEQWQDWLGRLTKLIAHGGAEGDEGTVLCEYEPGKWKTFRVPPQSPVWAFSDAMVIAKDKLEDAGIWSPGGDKVGAALVLLAQAAFVVSTVGTVAPAILPALKNSFGDLFKVAKSAGLAPNLSDIASTVAQEGMEFMGYSILKGIKKGAVAIGGLLVVACGAALASADARVIFEQIPLVGGAVFTLFIGVVATAVNAYKQWAAKQ